MKNTLVVARGQRWREGGFYKRAMPKNPYGDGTIVLLECINVNILVVRASNSFARSYHHWVKGRVSILNYFLQLKLPQIKSLMFLKTCQGFKAETSGNTIQTSKVKPWTKLFKGS